MRPERGASGRPARILVFDSGVGGLTVLAAARALRPDAEFVFVADNAAFPYGAWEEAALVARIVALFETLIARTAPDLCVVACNTASTLVLPALRARFAVPFVGTVPAIKPAAARTRSGLISVLATPGTVARDYTRALVGEFAAHCEVTLVGSAALAAIAEAKFAGAAVDPDAVRAEIAPAFIARGDRRTDTVVLACTHYPLLMDELRVAAPWPVEWIDPAGAIARRAAELLAGRVGGGEGEGEGDGNGDVALFTAPDRVSPALLAGLARYGLTRVAGLAAHAWR